MDLSAQGWYKNWWFNKNQSWSNKYRIPLKITKKKWLQKVLAFLFKYPLVFLTDFWHLMQFGMWSSVQVGLLLLSDDLTVFNFLLLKGVSGTFFEMIKTLHKKP